MGIWFIEGVDPPSSLPEVITGVSFVDLLKPDEGCSRPGAEAADATDINVGEGLLVGLDCLWRRDDMEVGFDGDSIWLPWLLVAFSVLNIKQKTLIL